MATHAPSHAKHIHRIIRQWPHDALRPITVPSALRRHLDAQTPRRTDEAAQINALYALLENRFAQQYKTSAEILRPAFNPQYYDNLRAEIEAAPKRGWLAKTWLKWGRIVRWS